MALTPEKLKQKQETLVERTAAALGISQHEADSLLGIGRKQSLRINTLRATPSEVVRSLDDQHIVTEPIAWMEDGLKADESSLTAIRDGDEVQKGYIYIQNAASWLPVLTLAPKPGETILDMCAAPGGKTSHIAQIARNEAFITANDNSRSRLHKLQNNLGRLGVEHVTFTLHDATHLARHVESESFDKILLDAPCSGEGMMTLDNKKDFESWSVAHIKRLQQLQKKLIVQAWHLLKPGGTLVYSTCTMAPEENEAVVDYLLRHNDDVILQDIPLRTQLDNVVASVSEWNGKHFDPRVAQTLRLKPSEQVEAFFVAKLTKAS